LSGEVEGGVRRAATVGLARVRSAGDDDPMARTMGLLADRVGKIWTAIEGR
jgi:hypothetical protein